MKATCWKTKFDGHLMIPQALLPAAGVLLSDECDRDNEVDEFKCNGHGSASFGVGTMVGTMEDFEGTKKKGLSPFRS